MSRGSRPVRLALALGLASALSAHVVFALEPGDTTDQLPPYRDRIIAAQQLQDLPAEEEDDAGDGDGLPHSFYAEAIASRSERGDDAFDEQGLAFGGFQETASWGTFSLDATLFDSSRDRVDGLNHGTNGLGGSATLWQRNLFMDGGWRIDNGFGVLNTPSPPLQRNQYRFYLPTVTFAGAGSEWHDDSRDLLLQGSFGRAGIYNGTRVVGFDLADGDVASLGAQWRWAPRWTGAVSFLGTHGRIVPDDLGEAVMEEGNTQALYAATAWEGARNNLQFNMLASGGDRGHAGGAWIDASARRGRYEHTYGLFRLDPDLSWGALPISNDIEGGYYRAAYQYARWSWSAGVDTFRSISGNGLDGSYATGFARYQASTTLGYGGSVNVRHTPDNAYSLQAFLDKSTDWGLTRLQADQAHGDGTSDSWQVSVDQAFPLKQGSHLSASVAYGALDYGDGGASRTATFALYGARDLTDRLSFDGNVRWMHGQGFDAVHGTNMNIGLNWRIASRWSMTAAYYQNQGSQRSPFILDPLATETPFISMPRDRSLFLTLRYEHNAGRSQAVLGGDPDGPAGAIGGSLFLDDNGDGVRSASEQPAANVTVVLDGRFAVRTDSLGNFEFPRVSTGPHVMTVVPDNLPLPWFLDDATAQRTVQVTVRQATRVDIGARRQH